MSSGQGRAGAFGSTERATRRHSSSEQGGGRKGKLYSPQWEHRVESILTYRKDLFDEVGIRQPPRTWAEVEEAARKLTRQNQWGFVWALSRRAKDAR